MSINNPEQKTSSPIDSTPRVDPDHFDGDIDRLNRLKTSSPAPEHSDDVLLGRQTIDERHGEVASKNKLGHLGRLGLVLAGAGVSVAAFLGIKAATSGEQTNEPAPNTPTASAPANPGEKTQQAPAVLSPAEAVGKKQAEYDVLNVQPTEAEVEKALQPLSADEYTPEEAIVEFGKKINVYTLGGKINNSDGELPETQASSEEGNILLASMFDESLLNGTELDDFRRIRTMVANRFNYYSVAYTPETLIDKNTGKKAAATGNESWEVLDSLDENTFTVNSQWETNFEALDRDGSFDNPAVDESHSLENTVVLEIIDGNYKIKSITTS